VTWSMLNSKVSFATPAAFLVVASLAACSTVTNSNTYSYRKIRTEHQSLGTGSPLWMKSIIQVDEYKSTGEVTSTTQVGFLYCEKVDAGRPTCVPVEVQSVPTNMTYSPLEMIRTGSGIYTSSSAPRERPAPESLTSYIPPVQQPPAAVPVARPAETTPPPTKPLDTVEESAPPRTDSRATGNDRQPAATNAANEISVIYEFNSGWNSENAKSTLMKWISRKVLVSKRDGKKLRGELLSIDVSTIIPGPGIVLWVDGERKSVLMKDILRITE